MKNFWKGKGVLVTGSMGFLGKNLVYTLKKLKAKVEKFDIKYTFFQDTRNIEYVKTWVGNSKIEIIFHLAAEAFVGKCLNTPKLTFDTNIMGTWNVLESARNNQKVKAIVIASSDKAYGDNILPYRETLPLLGVNTYDVSKSCADMIANCYIKTYNMPIGITRCGNIYGPYDTNPSRLVPAIMHSIIKKEQLKLRSNGECKRDFVYVDDIVDGYIKLAEKVYKGEFVGAMNLGNEKPIRILDLVFDAYEVAKAKAKFKVEDSKEAKNYEIQEQWLDTRLARSELGWKPKYSLKEGLKLTYKWWRGK